MFFACSRGSLAAALIFWVSGAGAGMVLDFAPTPEGGIALELEYNGVIQPDVSQDRWIDLTLPAGTIAGGVGARSDFHFADSLVSDITLGGESVTPSYVRLGNNSSSEQVFIFLGLQSALVEGDDASIRISAEWPPSDLPYAALRPGTYLVDRPRFGGAVVTIAPIPEPSASALLVVAASVVGAARRMRRPRRR